MASVAAGTHASAAAAAAAMADEGRTIDPEPGWGGSAYGAWKQAAERLEATAMRVRNMMG